MYAHACARFKRPSDLRIRVREQRAHVGTLGDKTNLQRGGGQDACKIQKCKIQKGRAVPKWVAEECVDKTAIVADAKRDEQCKANGESNAAYPSRSGQKGSEEVTQLQRQNSIHSWFASLQHS